MSHKLGWAARQVVGLADRLKGICFVAAAVSLKGGCHEIETQHCARRWGHSYRTHGQAAARLTCVGSLFSRRRSAE
jgi:hypothetical protein